MLGEKKPQKPFFDMWLASARLNPSLSLKTSDTRQPLNEIRKPFHKESQ